jgi:hypothetical protein
MSRRNTGDKCDWLAKKASEAAANEVRFEQMRDDIRQESIGVRVCDAVPIPILHNDDLIILQYSGWSINLYPDGTYWVQVTEGG